MSIRCARDIEAFRNCVYNCNVVDLGHRGSCFTWHRGNSLSIYVREWLGRFLASPRWVDLFPGIDVQHFPIYRSDHAPILLSMEKWRREDCNEKLFRFESFWLSKEGCRDIISDVWSSNLDSPIHAKLELYGNSLKD